MESGFAGIRWHEQLHPVKLTVSTSVDSVAGVYALHLIPSGMYLLYEGECVQSMVRPLGPSGPSGPSVDLPDVCPVVLKRKEKYSCVWYKLSVPVKAWVSIDMLVHKYGSSIVDIINAVDAKENVQFNVEGILDICDGSIGKEAFIKWALYPQIFNIWEPVANIGVGSEELLSRFYKDGPYVVSVCDVPHQRWPEQDCIIVGHAYDVITGQGCIASMVRVNYGEANCSVVTSATGVYIKTTRDIQPGEELTISPVAVGAIEVAGVVDVVELVEPIEEIVSHHKRKKRSKVYQSDDITLVFKLKHNKIDEEVTYTCAYIDGVFTYSALVTPNDSDKVVSMNGRSLGKLYGNVAKAYGGGASMSNFQSLKLFQKSGYDFAEYSVFLP